MHGQAFGNCRKKVLKPSGTRGSIPPGIIRGNIGRLIPGGQIIGSGGQILWVGLISVVKKVGKVGSGEKSGILVVSTDVINCVLKVVGEEILVIA